MMTKDQLLNIFGEHAHRSLGGTQMLNKKEFFAALVDIKKSEGCEITEEDRIKPDEKEHGEE